MIVLAQEEAASLRHNYLGTEHVLLGLCCIQDPIATPVLEGVYVTVDRVRANVVRIVGSGEAVVSGQFPFTPRATKVMERALWEALSTQHDSIGPEHLLLALVGDDDGMAIRILGELSASPDMIYRRVRRDAVRTATRQLGEAIAEFDAVIAAEEDSEDPESRLRMAVALNAKADALWREQRYEQALACFTQVVERFADATDWDLGRQVRTALRGRGAVLLGETELGEAIAEFDGVIAAEEGSEDPESRLRIAVALNAKADALRLEQRYEQALACFTQVVERFADATDGELGRQMRTAVSGPGHLAASARSTRRGDERFRWVWPKRGGRGRVARCSRGPRGSRRAGCELRAQPDASLGQEGLGLVSDDCLRVISSP